jgi:hypothetical protein
MSPYFFCIKCLMFYFNLLLLIWRRNQHIQRNYRNMEAITVQEPPHFIILHKFPFTYI